LTQTSPQRPLSKPNVVHPLLVSPLFPHLLARSGRLKTILRLDGKNPDGITQTASGSGSTTAQASTSGSGALSGNGATGLSALLLTFGAFALLA